MKIPKPEDVLFSAIQVKNLDLLFSNIVMTDTEADIDRRQRELIRNDVLMIMDNITCQIGDAEELLLEHYEEGNRDSACSRVTLSEKDDMPLIYLLHVCNIAEQLLLEEGWICQVTVDTDATQRTVRLDVFWSTDSIINFYKRLRREAFV